MASLAKDFQRRLRQWTNSQYYIDDPVKEETAFVDYLTRAQGRGGNKSTNEISYRSSFEQESLSYCSC